MGDKAIKILWYADNAESEDDQPQQLHKLQTTAEQFSMLISVDKIESMVTAKDPIRGNLALYEQPITQKINCIKQSKTLHDTPPKGWYESFISQDNLKD